MKIFNRKNKFLVLDVEGLQGLKPYDIGYIIADKDGRIYKQRSFCLFPNLAVNSAKAKTHAVEDVRVMTARNLLAMSEDNEQPKRKRQWQIVNNTEFIKIFTKECKRYGVKHWYSFNVKFDRGMVAEIFGDKWEEFAKNFEFRDIQTAILVSRLRCKKYLDFCFNNNFRTPKGYAQTKAETVYRYLSNDVTFKEAHTGLSDVLIEYEILLSAFRSKKKLIYGGIQAWRYLDEFAKSINHSLVRGE